MQSADNVARWFLSRNRLRSLSGESDLISNLKLQKLLYCAQWMHLALYGKPLFNDSIFDSDVSEQGKHGEQILQLSRFL
ncbi:MAG: hypothetical protein IJK81_12580 [Selenomonadaceae bacterium]|nr:hypothetical protein [Selenomonadaceae bacterium]